MACFGGPSLLGLVLSAIPVFGFTAYLGKNFHRSREQLFCAGAKLLVFCYAAVWALSTLSSLKLLILLTSSSPFAWSTVDALQAFVVLAVQGCVISILLHGYRSWAAHAMWRTVLVACCVSGLDLACRLVLLLRAGVYMAAARSCDADTPASPAPLSGHDSHGSRGLLAQAGSWSHMPHSQLDVSMSQRLGLAEAPRSGAWHALISRVCVFMTGGLLGVMQHIGMLGSSMWASQPHTAHDGSDSSGGRRLLDSSSGWQDAGNPELAIPVQGDVRIWVAGWAASPRFSSSCPDATWLKWGYLTPYATLLALTYGGLLLLPFTPLRDLLPARKALFRYLALCCATYALGAVGALLAGFGWTMGVCLWGVSHWLVDIGLAPLLYLTFLGNVLAGGSSAAEFDEDLLMYSEMRDAGVLDDDMPSDEPY